MDRTCKLHYIIIKDIIQLYYSLIDSNIDKFIEKINRPIPSIIKIQNKLSPWFCNLYLKFLLFLINKLLPQYFWDYKIEIILNKELLYNKNYLISLVKFQIIY